MFVCVCVLQEIASFLISFDRHEEWLSCTLKTRCVCFTMLTKRGVWVCPSVCLFPWLPRQMFDTTVTNISVCVGVC